MKENLYINTCYLCYFRHIKEKEEILLTILKCTGSNPIKSGKNTNNLGVAKIELWNKNKPL